MNLALGTEVEKDSKLLNRINSYISQEWILSLKNSEPRRIFLTVKIDHFKEALAKLLKEEGITHLITITGVDLGEEIEVIYHLERSGTILSVKVVIPKNRPVLPSITDLMGGATFYEREVHEILGVEFEGHPDLSRLILPEGWPKGLYPLRKDVSIETIRAEMEKIEKKE
jgi:NADH:ubiquinone oxidoreductase subunit C